MKRGYKHKTGIFGTDSERYVARLLLMMRNNRGDRRPDLVSVNGKYRPRLSVEVKSGRKQKGVMVDYQLHYAITTEEDYRTFLEEDLPEPEGLLPGANWSEAAPFLPDGSVAYHYWLVNRADTITSDDLNKPFAALQLRWGDIYSAPHRYAFAGFAAARANRTKSGSAVTSKELETIVNDMKETIKWDVVHRGTDYAERKANPQSWQDIHGRDFLALFHGDNMLATKDGQERIRIIRDIYPLIGSLKRITIPGPNSTTICILAEPDEEVLFDEQVRATVEERIPLIEKVTRARERAVSLLDKIKVVRQTNLFETGFENEEVRRQRCAALKLTKRQAKYFDNLAHWLAGGEREITADIDSHEGEGDASFEFGANAGAETDHSADGDTSFDFGANTQDEILATVSS